MPAFPDSWSRLNVVLSHDWLTGMRGGERVLEVLCDGFPSAPVVTMIHNRGAVTDVINRHPVRASWLQRVPGIFRCYRLFLPLMPATVGRMTMPDADLVLSTSHCVAKAVRPPPGARHLCYCFTPMRYAWLFFGEYFGSNRAMAAAAAPVVAALRAWDRRTAARVDRFVAISKHVRERIRAFYGRESDVVYPPVDIDRCTPGPEAAGSFDLVVSALVPYKRVDLAVRAYNRLGYPLKIVGVGTDAGKLSALSGPNVEWLGWRSDQEVLELYRSCRLLVFPGEEDFGIVPLEAQACGRPVVAYGRGGALETVRADVTGVFFEEQTESALMDAVHRCASTRWDRSVIRRHAEQFGVQPFVDGLARNIEQCLRAGPARTPSTSRSPSGESSPGRTTGS
jgi:glycosyltransferase involved in cell wall biosynthesis